MSIGERIKNRRLELGLSQSDLAKRMGYKYKSTISQVECDVANNMTTDKIAKFAKALSCSTLFLLGLEEKPLQETNSDLIARFTKDASLQKMVEMYLQLDSFHQDIINETLKGFVFSMQNENK